MNTNDTLFCNKAINKNNVYRITQIISIIKIYKINDQILIIKKKIKNQNKKLNNKKSLIIKKQNYIINKFCI